MNAPANRIPLTSNVVPRDPATQPFRVVLHQTPNGEWVTHLENVIEVDKVKEVKNLSTCGKYCSKCMRDFYWGHYFEKKDYNKALEDYQERCKKYGV